MERLDIQGKYAVITGAADGIGRALAYLAADAGLNLALADINEEGLRTLAADLEAKGTRVLTQRLDAGRSEEVEAFAKAVFDWADAPVALVFANAGIHGLTDGLRPDLAVWNRVIDVNLKGPVNMVSAFMQRLLGQGQPAQFVITGSQASFMAAPGMSPYVATKHAIWGLADTLRLELAALDAPPVGISIVAPSRAESGITRQQMERARQSGGEQGAQAYAALLVGPDKIAEVMLREAVKRAFWIVPSHETVQIPNLQNRVQAIADALPAGEIRAS